MLIKPKWYSLLPDYLKPPTEKIDKLDKLCRKYNVPNEIFAGWISESDWGTIKTQETMLKQLRSEMRGSSDKEVWQAVVMSRIQSYMFTFATDSNLHQLTPIVESYINKSELIESWHDVLKLIFQLDEEFNNVLSVSKSIVVSPISKMIEDQVHEILNE